MLQVRFTTKALEQMGELDGTIARQVLKKLRWMSENFDQVSHLPLTGNLKGVYKLRIGEYQALYTCNPEEHIIMVHFIQHRSEVYKTK